MKKLTNRIRYWLRIVPDWRDCRHASCWDGTNAQKRLMNILSPHFTEAKFREYVEWMKGRGCDTAHVILANAGDGEGGGYNALVHADHAKLAKKRIKALRLAGFAVVPWLVTDDSAAYVADLFAHAEERVKFASDHKLFKHASYVVLGLEMDEARDGASGWPKVAEAVRRHWPGKVGVHHCSGNGFRYARLGDIVLGQLEPKSATNAAIKYQIMAIKSMDKGAVGFEYERHPNRDKAQAALDAGAIGVGNW